MVLDLTTNLTRVTRARIVWGGILIGQVSFATIVLCFVEPVTAPNPVTLVVLAFIGVILLASAYYVRSESPSDRGSDPRIPPRLAASPLPRRFVTGLACAEAVEFVGVVARVLGQSLSTAIVFVAASILAVLLQYPRARDFEATEGISHVA
jgi:hypothetical protein